MRQIENANHENRARYMLVRVTPFSRWREDERPSIESSKHWLAVVRERMKLAALIADEARFVRIALELDEATAFVETNNVRA